MRPKRQPSAYPSAGHSRGKHAGIEEAERGRKPLSPPPCPPRLGAITTAQPENTTPLMNASAARATRPVASARNAAMHALAAIVASSVWRNPNRRANAAAGSVPATHPRVPALLTIPRKSSRYPRSSRRRLYSSTKTNSAKLKSTAAPRNFQNSPPRKRAVHHQGFQCTGLAPHCGRQGPAYGALARRAT